MSSSFGLSSSLVGVVAGEFAAKYFQDVKNASQEDVDKLEGRLSKGVQAKATGARNRMELSKARLRDCMNLELGVAA
jgi:hypothetical protein